MGAAASAVCFELAKRLKKAPRQIAQEIQTGLPPVTGVARLDVAGAGYLNAYFDRGAFWEAARSEAQQSIPQGPKPYVAAPIHVGSQSPTPSAGSEQTDSHKSLSHQTDLEHTS